jgi:hypothetical protein
LGTSFFICFGMKDPDYLWWYIHQKKSNRSPSVYLPKLGRFHKPTINPHVSCSIPTFGGISRPLFTQRWRSWKTGWIYFRAPLRLDGNWSEAFVVKKTGKNWVIYGSSTFPMDVVQKVDNPKKLDNPKKVMDLVQNFSTTCQRNRTSKGTRFSANQRWLHLRRWRRRGESHEFTRKSVAETGWTWGADDSWDYLTSEYSGVIGISWGCNASIYIYYRYIHIYIICIYII